MASSLSPIQIDTMDDTSSPTPAPLKLPATKTPSEVLLSADPQFIPTATELDVAKATLTPILEKNWTYVNKHSGVREHGLQRYAIPYYNGRRLRFKLTSARTISKVNHRKGAQQGFIGLAALDDNHEEQFKAIDNFLKAAYEDTMVANLTQDQMNREQVPFLEASDEMSDIHFKTVLDRGKKRVVLDSEPATQYVTDFSNMYPDTFTTQMPMAKKYKRHTIQGTSECDVIYNLTEPTKSITDLEGNAVSWTKIKNSRFVEVVVVVDKIVLTKYRMLAARHHIESLVINNDSPAEEEEEEYECAATQVQPRHILDALKNADHGDINFDPVTLSPATSPRRDVCFAYSYDKPHGGEGVLSPILLAARRERVVPIHEMGPLNLSEIASQDLMPPPRDIDPLRQPKLSRNPPLRPVDTKLSKKRRLSKLKSRDYLRHKRMKKIARASAVKPLHNPSGGKESVLDVMKREAHLKKEAERALTQRSDDLTDGLSDVEYI